MDLLTWLGLESGIGIVFGAVASGSSLSDFINQPGLMIVVFGTIAVTLIKFRWVNLIQSFSLAFRTAFTERTGKYITLYQELKSVAELIRQLTREAEEGIPAIEFDEKGGRNFFYRAGFLPLRKCRIKREYAPRAS